MSTPILRLGEKAYPQRLAQIHQPPKQLYLSGELPSAEHWVAIVGSRRATNYGKEVAHYVSAELARRGVVIVSGLAVGIDSAAHRGALEAGGKTVAVLGGGLSHAGTYHSNYQLARQIVEADGALITEYAPGAPPLRQHFPARNRIIAGLCQLVVVAEAALKSGSLITATFALEEGREVMAVPGNINQPGSAGCNNLIKVGAQPLTAIEDVLHALGLEVKAGQQRQPPEDSQERLIFELIGQGVNATDDLIKQSGIAMADLSRLLTSLEINGHVRSAGAGQWVIT